MKISATVNKGKPEAKSAEIEVNIPETLDELVGVFGKDAVASAAVDSFVISVQAAIRRALEDKTSKDGKVTPGKSVAEIQAQLANWKPDVRTGVRQTAFEKAASSIDKLSDAERKELLARLTGKKVA